MENIIHVKGVDGKMDLNTIDKMHNEKRKNDILIIYKNSMYNTDCYVINSVKGLKQLYEKIISGDYEFHEMIVNPFDYTKIYLDVDMKNKYNYFPDIPDKIMNGFEKYFETYITIDTKIIDETTAHTYEIHTHKEKIIYNRKLSIITYCKKTKMKTNEKFLDENENVIKIRIYIYLTDNKKIDPEKNDLFTKIMTRETVTKHICRVKIMDSSYFIIRKYDLIDKVKQNNESNCGREKDFNHLVHEESYLIKPSITMPSYIICENFRELKSNLISTGFKSSFHIIINWLVQPSTIPTLLKKHIFPFIDKDIMEAIDLKIYNKHRIIRMTGTLKDKKKETKLEIRRNKEIYKNMTYGQFKSSLITYCRGIEMDEYIKNLPKMIESDSRKHCDAGEYPAIEKMISEIQILEENFVMRDVFKTSNLIYIILDRKKHNSIYCNACEIYHGGKDKTDGDNNWVILIDIEKVTVVCRNYRVDHGKYDKKGNLIKRYVMSFETKIFPHVQEIFMLKKCQICNLLIDNSFDKCQTCKNIKCEKCKELGVIAISNGKKICSKCSKIKEKKIMVRICEKCGCEISKGKVCINCLLLWKCFKCGKDRPMMTFNDIPSVTREARHYCYQCAQSRCEKCKKYPIVSDDGSCFACLSLARSDKRF